VPGQDGTQERLVAPVEAENDVLADRAELVTLDVVAPQERQGPVAWAAFAAGRKGRAIHHRKRLDQRIQRDRVLRVFLSQLQELQGELLETRQNLLAFLARPGL